MARGGKGNWKQTLQAAIEDAFQNADKDPGENVFAVEIQIKGNNPITGYRVVLSPTNDP
jgi:hypothetical protein